MSGVKFFISDNSTAQLEFKVNTWLIENNMEIVSIKYSKEEYTVNSRTHANHVAFLTYKKKQEVDLLLAEMKEVKEQLRNMQEDLRIHINYAPPGEGYSKAKENFEEMKGR
jgi:hypothetical protein